MRVSRALPVALGAIAVASGITMVTFDIIFAVTLSHTSSSASTRVTAIVASGVGSAAVVLLVLLLGRQAHYHSGAHIQDFGHGRQHTYLLAGFGGVFGILSAVSSAIVLALMKIRVSELPKRMILSSTMSLIVGGFAVWAVALLSQIVFVISMVRIQRRDFRQQIQPYRVDAPQSLSDMQEASRPPMDDAHRNPPYRESSSMESKSAPSSGRSRSGSDTMTSFRSSLTQVVRPITSKTKLISHKSSYQPAPIESGHRDTRASIEEGFDSWDTSTVDAQSRQALESASPKSPRGLETIPASPATSRSASPGFPLDLEPPRTRHRSRSYSPANSHKDLLRSRTTSHTEGTREAHIHPLFRTDSPTPPPAATPGTIVTAAPGAGQVISDRQSIRSMKRIRSGSLPSSPLMHSDSLDSIRKDVEREERETFEEVGGERTLTPPIPEYILGTGPRNSTPSYNPRKKTQVGLGKVGEVQNA